MNECRVLRCREQPAGTYIVNSRPLMQIPVCFGHLKRLQAGEAWLLDTDEDFHLRMGDDVPPTIIGSHAHRANVEQSLIELELETTHPLKGDRTVSLMLSHSEAKALRNLLAPLVGKMPDAEGE